MNPQFDVENDVWLPDDRYWEPRFYGYVTEWERFVRKDGKPGRWIDSLVHFCHLHVCEECGRLDGAHRVRYRYSLYDLCQGKCLVCTGCARRLRPLARVLDEAAELARLSRKLLRTKPDGHQHR